LKNCSSVYFQINFGLLWYDYDERQHIKHPGDFGKGLGMVAVVGEHEAALNRYINQELRDLL
jgi:hypothetical protein